MKRLILATLGLLLLLAPTAVSAQPYSPPGLLSNTTLNGDITDTQTTLVLGSASASAGSSFGAPAAGQCLYIDRELMRISSMSSTTATVRRGTVNRSTHANSAIILTGPCDQFKAADPPAIGDDQNCATWGVLPWVNVNTGDTWWCELAGSTAGQVSVTNTVTRNGTAGSRRVAQ